MAAPDLFGSSLQNFYSNKSVLPSWNFLVDIHTDKAETQEGLEINPSVSLAFSKLKYHHIIDVSVPFYKFTKEVTMYGSVPKTFPVLSYEGLDIRLVCEDDRAGTIVSLINRLQKTIINSSGVYNRLNNNKIGDMVIHLYNYNGVEVCQWIAKSVYFLGADDLSLSYKSDDSVKYNLNFGFDVMMFRENIDIDVQESINNYIP